MKLNAIYGNGSRLKDFVDMYALLEYFSLQELLEASEKKYPENNVVMTKNALIHFDDIDFTVPIDYIGLSIGWPVISDRLKQAFHNPRLIFDRIPDLARKLIEENQEVKNKKNKGKKL